MNVELVFVTYNRLRYTRQSLPSLLSDPAKFSLVLWDNGSTDGTQEYLDSIQDSRIRLRNFSSKNHGLHGAANAAFSESKADLVGIAENDFIYKPGWIKTLSTAHADVPEFGKIACWHLGEAAFDVTRAGKKIQTFGKHRIFRHPWTGGGSGLMKLNTWKECGPFESGATTAYWMRMAQKGYVNGWYYPLIHLEHMDYPWSPYFAFKENEKEWLSVKANVKYTGLRNAKDARKEFDRIVKVLNYGSWDVKDYLTLRYKIRRKIANIFRKVFTLVS